MGDGGRGQGGRLRPFDRRLLGRVRVARRTLAVCVAAGLAAALLLLAQMTLLAAVIAGAAEGRLDQVPRWRWSRWWRSWPPGPGWPSWSS